MALTSRRRRGRGRRGRQRAPPAGAPRTLTPQEAEAFISRFAPDFISIHARDGRCLYASANVEEMFGWEPRQLLGRNAREYLHPEDAGHLQLGRASGPVGAQGQRWKPYRLRCADGTWRWVETRSRAELSSGRIRRMVWLTRFLPGEPPQETRAAGEAIQAPAEPGFLQEVRSALARLGFTKSATATSVASEMGVSLRTLQRRLQRLSCSVSSVRDDVFRRIAETMLRDQASTVDEVVARLGFSSRSAFHRAFRRWTGLTPGAFRVALPARAHDVSGRAKTRPGNADI